MTFQESYNYILSLSNLPRKEYMAHPRQTYFKRIQFFLDLVGNPEKKIPHCIHIAGTSGKGSVTSFLHSILHNAGKKVGSTYSPHPTIITERWKIGNDEMSEQEFIEIVEYIKPKLDAYIRISPYDIPSFFEITDIMGFIWFAHKRIDWLVLETGMGGRHDATNIIPKKDIAVLTNVGLDHVGLIGNNKEEIAQEKVGIFKKGCKVFTMEKDKKILAIIEKEAKTQNTPIVPYSTSYTKEQITPLSTSFVYEGAEYTLQASGKHQTQNAIMCINIARSLGIQTSIIQNGLASAEQPLRMEIVSRSPLIILDSAHNPDKMRSTVDAVKRLQLNSSNKRRPNIHLLVGFSQDKKLLLPQLLTLKPTSVACTRQTMNIFRKVIPPQEIAKKIHKKFPKTKVEVFLNPEDAWKWSLSQIHHNDILLVTGSIFLSGQLRQHARSSYNYHSVSQTI